MFSTQELPRTQPSDVPSLKSLYWDNYKTVVAYSGVGLGFPIAISSAVSNSCPELGCVGFPLGAVMGLTGAVLGATVGAMTVSPVLTYVAQKTRKFLPKNKITPPLKVISEITDKEVQHYFINKIISEDKRLAWLSVRSYESFSLMAILKSDVYELEDKWKALCRYLKTKNSAGAYVHNGKKLFNAIITLVPEIQLWQAIKERSSSFRSLMESLPLEERLKAQRYHDCHGESQIHWAARLGNTDVVDYCYEEKLDLNRKVALGKNAGKTALDLAVENKQAATTEKLLSRGATSGINDQYLMYTAVQNGDIGTIDALLEYKPRLCNQVLTQGMTAVQLADVCGESKLADHLAKKGADDHVMTHLKDEIKLLRDIIFLDKWNKEGVALFGTNVPGSIITLRYLFNQFQNDRGLDNRANVQAVYEELKKMKFGSNIWRSSHASRLYKFIQNVGKNDLGISTSDSLTKLKNDIVTPKPVKQVVIAGMARM